MANPHQRSESPTPSHLSMKSMTLPPRMGCESSDSDLRSESPTPSHLSMKSMTLPPRLDCDSPDLSDLRSESPTPSHLSMKSMTLPPRLDDESSASDLSLGEQTLKDPIDSICGHDMLPTSEDSKYLRKRSRTYLAQHQQEMMTTDDSPLKKRKSIGDTFSVREVLMSHKTHLKSRFEQIAEGNLFKRKEARKHGSPTYLNKIYTDLFITEGECTGVNKEHEVWQIDATLSAQCTEKHSISCNDIFKHRSNRIVLTMGIAGIGKTVLVQKFILDWSDGKANTDLDMIFAIPFRALNLVKDKMFNLSELLLAFHPELERLFDMEKHKNCKMLFILDGLDESRLSLNFQEEAMLHSDKQSSTVDMLISSLICGNLLPSARIWITSRKAAVSQIPSKYINLFTEVQGFNDPQKEEYFKKRIDDPVQANKIITHIKASRSLHIMCHIPVFCWISATVLQKILVSEAQNEVPRTLTGMFIHFLLIQTSMKHQKFVCDVTEKDCHEPLETNKEMILQLAKLAFKHLQKGNLMFYEDDLTECGIDVHEASVYSGMCTEIFNQEIVFVKEKVYCFVHLSIQEFLAALHIFYSYVFKEMEKLKIFLKGKLHDLTLDDLLKNAMNKALESPNGHLDLFVRFLHGFALKSNQKLLKGILPNPTCNSTSTDKAIRNLKCMQRSNISPERCINLLHCLTEMNDTSIQDDIQRLLNSGKQANKQLSLAHCTALAYMLLVSEKVLEEFQLSEYKTTDEGRRRLIPAVRNCKKALLAGCKLTDEAYESVNSALHLPNSPLKELDLRRNHLSNSTGNLLCVSLKSPNCNLEILRLAGCKLSQEFCVFLTSALQSPNSHLRELDLSSNNLRSSIKDVVHEGLMSKHCRLEVLRVSGCNLTKSSCEIIATFLKQEDSCLKELDISHNDLHDAGIECICPGLQSPHCKVEVLRLSACLISEKGCFCLASVVESHPLLRELDLQCNNPGDAGRMLTAKQKDSFCKLELLNISNCSVHWLKPGPQKYACDLTLDLNTAHRHLSLSRNLKATYTKKRQHHSDHPDRFIVSPIVLCKEGLSERHYWEVEWRGNGVRIGATYKGIQRKERNGLDGSAIAWCVECCSERFTVYHANWSQTISSRSGSHSTRVGVYLDWPAGMLSFFSVSSDGLNLLHTFETIFAEPLYPGFYVATESEVKLCSVLICD